MAQHIQAENGNEKSLPWYHNNRTPLSGPTPSGPFATLQKLADDSEPVQRISALQDMANARYAPIQRKVDEKEDIRKDRTARDSAPLQRHESSQGANGLPPDLKSGIENLSGISMADVTVQRNSSEPAKVGAHAFAQGTNIHLGPGQDKHLPHEAWHVVQQKQGRVKPTMQMKGVAINDDVGLEREADVMGAKAMQLTAVESSATITKPQTRLLPLQLSASSNENLILQRLVIRIRNIKELMGIGNPTIMDASERIKSQFQEGDMEGREDIGINQATANGHRQLGLTEQLIIVAHGSAPSQKTFFLNGLPKLGGHSPIELAAKLESLFPPNYTGAIYMDGCYTSRRLGYADGTSFIELFAEALATMRSDIGSRVTGNLGPASTSAEGHEIITITAEEAEIGKAKGWAVHEVQKDGGAIEYKVISPFGLAHTRAGGDYNDMGLSEQAREMMRKQKETEIQEYAPRDRRNRLANIRNRGGNVTSSTEGNLGIGNADL